MLYLIAALVILSGVLIFWKARAAAAASHSNFGSMSEQWLAEHSASYRP